MSGSAYADTETGAPDVDNSSVTLTASQQVIFEQKQLRVNELADEMQIGSSTLPDGCLTSCPARNYQLGNVSIRYEGEGNSYWWTGCSCYRPKIWTCGPASTRNMVRTMGAADPGEGSLESAEGTSSKTGTVFGNIVNVLNNQYGNYGTWNLHHPSSKADLIATVATDTYYYGEPLIENVYTGYLPFWNGHWARHYDMIYGYNYNAATVSVQEEWDTAVNYVTGYGNPYGLHSAALQDDLNAITSSPSGKMTI